MEENRWKPGEGKKEKIKSGAVSRASRRSRSAGRWPAKGTRRTEQEGPGQVAAAPVHVTRAGAGAEARSPGPT